MNHTSVMKGYPLLAVTAALFLGSGSPVSATPAISGADTYDPATQQLTVSHLSIGNIAFDNLVVTVGKIITGPAPTNAVTGVYNTYDPSSRQLTISVVNVGGSAYFQPVVQLSGIVSFGTVEGMATYDGQNLTLPAVQVLGGAVYTDVVLAVGIADIVSVGNGLPTVAQNQYDPATHRLTLPVAGYDGHFYTNVTLTVAAGAIKTVGGSQAKTTTLHTFGMAPDGNTSYSGVIQGSDGNFYGTASAGGAYGKGTVFKVTPAGLYSTLYSFGASANDGAYPDNALTQGSDGNFYSTTSGGGDFQYGTIFSITPSGVETVLYSFTAADGGAFIFPNALIVGSDGNLYGSTVYGGAQGSGTVFRINPAGSGYQVIHVFAEQATDGMFPWGLTLGGDGTIYGTTQNGGSGPSVSGTLFQITTSGTYSQLYSFGTTAGDGNSPEAPVIIGTDGNLYGTTAFGGANNGGTVFSATTTGSVKVLYSFGGEAADLGFGYFFFGTGTLDGGIPYYGLVQGNDGALYGTTNYGGAYNLGTVFRLTADGQETVLHSFGNTDLSTGGAEGAYPTIIIQATDGHLYGTTSNGGVAGGGAVFRLP